MSRVVSSVWVASLGLGSNLGLSYASSVGAMHFNTSAKHNKGVEEMFRELAKSKLAVALRQPLPYSADVAAAVTVMGRCAMFN